MIATKALELYVAALQSDATTLMQRVGFDDRVGRQRLLDLIDGRYRFELMVIVQLVRWYEIGLAKPGEIDVPPPELLMSDLRRRIAASPNKHVSSFIMNGTFQRMVAWWTENTITTAWRSVKVHVRASGTTNDLCDAVADFLWEARNVLTVGNSRGNRQKEVGG